MTIRLIFLIIMLGILFGCGLSKSEEVLNSLTNRDKADILNRKGIEMYISMVDNNDVKKAPEIKDVFRKALDFDPNNAEAIAYIANVDKFVNDYIGKYILAAKLNLEKKRYRTDNENYFLCVSLQKMSAIDPDSKELVLLRDSSKDIREKFAKKMLALGDLAMTHGKKSKIKDALEKGAITAIQYYKKGLTASVTTQDVALFAGKDKADISVYFPSWLNNIDELIAKQEFATAMRNINYIEAKIKDEHRMALLEDRKKRMIAQVENLYKAVVDNYVNENFDQAVDQFEGVLAVSPGYKDARNYLKEAESMQRILKSY